jgi:hypothetical protein
VDVPAGGAFLDIVEGSPFTIDVQVNPGDNIYNTNDPIFTFDNSFSIDFFSSGYWTVALFTTTDPPVTITFDLNSPEGLPIGLTVTPLPAALPLFAGGLGLVGFLSRRKKRAQATA